MQRTDLDRAAELFDLAGDGRDEASWARRFQEHIGHVMRRHGANLKSGGGAIEQRLELIRARLELNEVVAERLEARATGVDSELGVLMKRLRSANAPLLAELVATAMLERSDQEPAPEAPVQAHSVSAAPAMPPAPATPATPRRPRTSPQASPGLSPRSGIAVPSAAILTPVPSLGAPSFLTAGLSTVPSAHSVLDEMAEPQPQVFSATGARRSVGGTYKQMHDVRRHREATAARMPERGQSNTLVARPEKDLTLRQLRVIVSMVYASKAEHDERCAEMREPRETMEQHLYSFLGKRYGQRGLVEDWARAIFRAIEREATRECDIAIFGKILQNRLAENFAPVQDTLCKTVNKLLYESLQQRYPQRTPAEIDNMSRAWTRSGVPLSECERVARWMYDLADSERVLRRLRDVPRQAQPQEGAEPAETELLKYKEFLQTLVIFQMQLTEDFLADFIRLFIEVDVDEDGVVCAPQLQELLKRLGDSRGLSTSMVEDLAEAREGAERSVRGRQSATFSECVEIFAGMIGARSAPTQLIIQEAEVEDEEEDEDSPREAPPDTASTRKAALTATSMEGVFPLDSAATRKASLAEVPAEALPRRASTVPEPPPASQQALAPTMSETPLEAASAEHGDAAAEAQPRASLASQTPLVAPTERSASAEDAVASADEPASSAALENAEAGPPVSPPEQATASTPPVLPPPAEDDKGNQAQTESVVLDDQ